MNENEEARSYAEIEPVDPEAIWQDFIYAGGATVFARPGGSGKSFVGYDLAARVSRGDVMPDGSPGSKPGAVIIASLEDSSEAAAVHRLTAAKADLAQIFDASRNPSDVPFTLRDLPWLRQVNDQVGGARLVIIDTLSTAAGISLTGVAAAQNTMNLIQRFAEDTGAATLVLHHVTKAGSVAGSPAIVNSVRQVLTIARDVADPRIRSVHVEKTNSVREGIPDVRFTLSGSGKDTVVEWLTEQVKARRASSGTSGQARIRLLLRNTTLPLTAQEIASRTGIRYPTVRVQLSRLVRSGQVQAPSKNAYVAAPAA